MRPLTAFAVILGVVVILATGLFFAVSWFGLSDLGNFPAQVSPSGPDNDLISGGDGDGPNPSQILTADLTTPSNNSSFEVGESISFAAIATGGSGIYRTYDWEFGDGHRDTGPTIDYSYNQAGAYTVSVRITDSLGTLATDAIQLTITAQERLEATISNPVTGATFLTNQSISFSGAASGGSELYVSYRWEFGDGTNSLSQNTSHNYTQDNVYTVSLIVTDSEANQDTASIQIEINAPEGGSLPLQPDPGGGGAEDEDEPSLPEPLQASVDAPSNNSVFQPNQAINFSGSATGGDSPYRYRWNFGDGAFSTSRNTTHPYAQAGNRLVTLEVTDADSITDMATITLNIQTPVSDDDGGGGGGGGGGGTPNPPPVSSPVLPLVLPPVIVAPPTPCVSGATLSAVVGPFSFGMRDNAQVTLLQQLLSKDATIYPEKIVSGFYGPLTRAAVQRFQLRYGILTPNSDPELLGFAGPVTRAKINQILGGATICPISIPASTATPAGAPIISTIPTPTITLTPEQKTALLSSLDSLLSSFRQNLVPWLANLGSFLTP